MNTNMQRVAIILLFVITFVLVGHTAPILHATYAPSDNMIEVHEFSAENTTVDAEEHNIYFKRTVSRGTSAEVVNGLYLINDNGNRVEVDSKTMDRYLQEGKETIVIPYELPKNLSPGEYRYMMITEIELANGRVTRTFEFESEKFIVSE